MNNRRQFILKGAAGVAAALIYPVAQIASGRERSVSSNKKLKERIHAALCGIAVGEAMGAPVEGWNKNEIISKLGITEELTEFINGSEPLTGKGYGRITDDTLLTEALIRTYSKGLKHFDAYDYEKYFIPEIAYNKVFVPEHNKEEAIIERLWYADKYPWQKLTFNNSEPRSTGIGNSVNCGLAIMVMPIGAVNAGDPFGAYQEAAAFGLAHNESYGLEGGAVMAAAYAEAFRPGSTINSVINESVNLAQDGTKDAIMACTEAVNVNDNMLDCITKVRKAFLPFSGLSSLDYEKYIEESSIGPKSGRDRYTPSRIGAIEELTVGFAMLKYGQGNFQKTLTPSVYYGNDNDCIAGIACGLLGGIYGMNPLPQELIDESEKVNKRDYMQLAGQLFDAVKIIYQKDIMRMQERENSIG